MHQYALWCALEAEGLGVNLQHYNPLIDTRLETMYDVPPTWSLKSQMVFGKPTGQPGEKVGLPPPISSLQFSVLPCSPRKENADLEKHNRRSSLSKRE